MNYLTPIMLIRVQSVTPRLAFDIFYLHTKFGDSQFRHFRDMIAGIETDKYEGCSKSS